MKTHVVFENLGIDITMNRRFFEFKNGGGIYYYALIICAGFLLAWLYISRQEKKITDKDYLTDLVLWALPSAVIGARLYYVLFSLSDYISRPIEIFFIWQGGLAFYGGLIGAFIAIVIYCRLKKLNLLHYLDLGAIGFLIGQSIGRWGNFVNGEAHGSICESSFLLGMHINGQGPFHPTFLYESLLNLIGFLILHFLSKKITFPGFRLSFYLLWYGAVRFFIEPLRTDSLYIGLSGIRVSQALSAIIFILGLLSMILLIKRTKRHKIQ